MPKPSYDRNHPEIKKAIQDYPGAVIILEGARHGINPDITAGLCGETFWIEIKDINQIPKKLHDGNRFDWLREKKNKRKEGSQIELAKNLYMVNRSNPLWVVCNADEMREVFQSKPDYLKAIPEFLKVGRK